MRKAVQAATRRNQRRKDNAPNEAAVVVIKEAPSSANGHAAAETKRNKTSPEEAALTAKNYRLAKELVSDGPNPCTACMYNIHNSPRYFFFFNRFISRNCA